MNKPAPHFADNRDPLAGPADYRLDRTQRLLGIDALNRIRQSHLAVIGLGGVGSYTVEGLARTGIGALTLIDFDTVCVTNFNRQLHAVSGAIGRAKAELMAERVRAINPDCQVTALCDFFNRETAPRLFNPAWDGVIDCIDNVTAKIHLLATCCRNGVPVISCLGASAKLDPTRVRTAPLAATHTDRLGRALRKFLRRRYRVTEAEMDRITAVFSDEPTVWPQTDPQGLICGDTCVCPNADNGRHTCSQRHIIHGSVVFVTAVFGMVAAGEAVRQVLHDPPRSPSTDPFINPIDEEAP
jgi:tRNA A37 threonylcarbamoyladenosine dehydratase